MRLVKAAKMVFVFSCVFALCGDSCLAPPPQLGSTSGGFPVSSEGEFVDPDGNVTSTFTWGGAYVTGGWLSDNSGAAGTDYNFTLTTDDNGNAFVSGGRVYANWSSSITWGSNPSCNGYSLETADFAVNPLVGIPWVCPVPEDDAAENVSTNFVLPGAVPSTLTGYGDFSTTYGNPQIRVYVGGATPSLVATELASAVVPGVSATFPFPVQSNGSALAEGFYALVNTNVASGGGLKLVSPSYLAVGGSTTLSSAFGVDAGDVTQSTITCLSENYINCSGSSFTYAVAILTQYNSNEVSYYTPNATSGGLKSEAVAVGAYPVAAKLYGTDTATWSHSYGTESETIGTTFPSNAIVVNSGSNNVSLVNFANNANVTVAVGTQPMAVALNSAGTMAYVANYGSGTLSVVNLSTGAVTDTVNVGAGLLSVAMDPSGSYVWAGGTNYIYEVSLSTFAVVASVHVTGSVTSLAASNAQNELVYTLVDNCCTSSSTYAANELLLSNLSKPGSYAGASASPYAPYTMNGTLPTAAALPQASAVVSSRFSNGMGASSTPTGFVIYDLISHQQIMTGTTATPVRGIAADPDCMFAYFTLPDSNEYITVPLESAP